MFNKKLLASLLLAVGVAMLGAMSADAYCEHCKEWTNENPAPWEWEDDAQCCVVGNGLCEALPGFYDRIYQEWCTVETIPTGWKCAGAASYTCDEAPSGGGDGPGDGGGTDECTIAMDEYCPVSCPSCTRIYY